MSTYRPSVNAQHVASLVREYPGLTRHALMRIARRGQRCRNEFWYRDCAKALVRGLIHMDDKGRLWEVVA